MKIKILFDGNFEIERREIHLSKGDVLEVPQYDGLRLVDGLCAEEVDEMIQTPKARTHKKRTEVTNGDG